MVVRTRSTMALGPNDLRIIAHDAEARKRLTPAEQDELKRVNALAFLRRRVEDPDTPFDPADLPLLAECLGLDDLLADTA